jgi:hypothetical protein
MPIITERRVRYRGINTMSRSQQNKLPCPKCGHKQDTTIWESVNVTEAPELREQLFKAELNMFRCEKCACKAFVSGPLLYHDMTREFCVQYYPPEALQDGELLQQFTKDGKLNVKEVFGDIAAVSGAMRTGGYMTEPHIIFDMEEMQRYVSFRERLFQREASEAQVYEALIALLHRGTEDSFVFIQEPRSEKFVQFGRGRFLGMDVPCTALTSEEADRASRFFNELGEEYPREYHAPDPKTGKTHHGATFHHDFAQDARAAARAAIAFFVNVYGFPSDVEISIEEH